jgi:hypothetical protein
MSLQTVNTHAVGYTGLGIGGVAILAAVGGFFKICSDPKIVLGFTYEWQTHQFGPNMAAVIGGGIAVVGALVVALLSTWLGRPPTVPADTKGSP